MTIAHEIRLKSRPFGTPTLENFEFATVELANPEPGEILVRNLWMSVDPYMRGRMSAGESYVEPFVVGEALEGGAVGEVVASNAPGLEPGDIVTHYFGWRDQFTADANAVQKLDLRGLPPQAFLGVAGMPGLTAYAGLIEVAALRDGDVVFVSGAAGAVGSLVCQIAKAKGHTVIGSAGGADKVAYLKEIGVDHVIDYKAEPDLSEALRRCAPDGIDVYFDNVGGAHLEAALDAARDFARFAICGMISIYNNTERPTGPHNIANLITKKIRMQGFIVTEYFGLMDKFVDELTTWIDEGKVRWQETVVDGLDRAPEAFMGLFSGQNIGKMLVKLHPTP